MTPRDFV